MKRKVLLWGVLILSLLLIGCGNDEDIDSYKNDEVVISMISVQRTGNLLTNIGTMEVWIDDEKVFEVDGNSTNSAKIKMTVGEHTIQTKGQGDKSKKLKFTVAANEENEFYYTAEISNWYGVKLEERNYISEE